MTKLAAIVAAIAVLGAQPPTFRAGVEGVRVDVKVTSGGRPVGGLTARDFDLRDSGVPQQIDSVTLEDVPLAVTIALDVSDSVSGERLAQLKKATRAALDGLKGDDRFALLAFTQGIRRLSPFTADRATLAAAIEGIGGTGGTAVYDAAYIALTLRDDRAGRSLVLLCTDGWDTASWLPAGAVYDAARRSDSVVYAVSLKYTVQPAPFRTDASAGLPIGFPEEERPDRFLETLTDATGGDVFFADTSKDLTPRFVGILKEFRNRYLLTYTPQGVPQAGWHPIEVTVKRPGAKVTARRGYAR
jgi:VWFA-related protein